jgi:uncharacterized phage protein (TIGR02218 family)
LTYDALETSDSDGYVAELYEFLGAANDYYYTSFASAQTYGGHTYTPMPGLKRKGITTTTVGGSSSGDLEIELPYNSALAAEYAFTDVPASLRLNLRRKHISDPDDAAVVIWSGEVGVWTVKGRMATFKVPSVFSVALETIIPKVRWQKPCNNLLYDGRCKVVRNDHKVDTTISSATDSTITVASVGTWVGTEGVGGEVVNNVTGERRTIVSHSGTVLTIKLPFSSFTPGDSVTLFEGCDHSGQTCKDKFDNIDNYGGFLLIPSVNPFGSTVR